MIIKRPEKENIPALTGLWMQAFGDSKDFIDGFFRTGFSYDRCLLAQAQGQLLAALYWFDCQWQDKKVAYLYAIATHESHRGKGICTELMKHTHRHLQKAGYSGAILVPADEGLARMYGKMGYIPCASQEMQNAKCKMQNEPISVAEYRKLQSDLLPPDAVVHTDAAFAYLQTFAGFYKTENGILCKTQEHIQEILPYTPTGKNRAMYLSLTEDKTLPAYFALPLA